MIIFIYETINSTYLLKNIKYNLNSIKIYIYYNNDM